MDFNFGEINPVGNKKKFPLRCRSNSNEFVYGKERDLRHSCWTGKGLTVEVHGEEKRRVAWDYNKGGPKSFKWTTRGLFEGNPMLGLGPKPLETRVGHSNFLSLDFLGPICFEVGESSSMADPRPVVSSSVTAHDLVLMLSFKASHDNYVAQIEVPS